MSVQSISSSVFGSPTFYTNSTVIDMVKSFLETCHKLSQNPLFSVSWCDIWISHSGSKKSFPPSSTLITFLACPAWSMKGRRAFPKKTHAHFCIKQSRYDQERTPRSKHFGACVECVHTWHTVMVPTWLWSRLWRFWRFWRFLEKFHCSFECFSLAKEFRITRHDWYSHRKHWAQEACFFVGTGFGLTNTILRVWMSCTSRFLW